ncbi:MAG: bacterial Ig-like domain-containing protein [Clostridiales bacterium]|nr:bacterial Ig-like domain-containing protein [Clostridiales bacterium]
MKKKLTVLIALIMVLTIVLPVLAACDLGGTKTVKEISVVNPKTEYYVGDTIDYDSLVIKVTYSDGTTEQKTVAQLKATVSEADLSQSGTTSYTITYEGKSDQVHITVKVKGNDKPVEVFIVSELTEPAFYTNYVRKSSKQEESMADFRVSGETYEVGNVNKFIFRPSISGLDLAAEKDVTIENAKTVATVSMKESKTGTYQVLSGADLDEYVAIDDNTYKFTEQAADKYFKIVITPDEEEYDLDSVEDDSDVTITIEVKVVGGGYNVYDQLGLSVMADLEKGAWSEIWKCDVEFDESAAKFNLKEKQGVTPLKREADEEPLYKYVGKVDYVILHDSIQLDPDLMPSLFFWSSDENTLSGNKYTEAIENLNQHKVAQDGLVGTLRDGFGGGSEGDYEDMMRVIDCDKDSKGHNIKFAPELNFNLNMAKAIFSTSRVSVSGNYNSITSPAKGARSKDGRLLEVFLDWDKDTAQSDPYSHWAVFQLLQSRKEGAPKTEFTIKNIAMDGNNPQVTNTEETFHSAGLQLSSNYTTSISCYNVVATRFFTNLLGDNFGDFTFDSNDQFAAQGEQSKAYVNLDHVKFSNSYSNMMYLWRSNATVTNSTLVGSGGPLFILCDGIHEGVTTTTSDEGGPTLTVDDKSELQAYANGNEAWYKAQSPYVAGLFTYLKKMEPLLNNMGKTMLFTDANNPNRGNELFNVIALMICSPGALFDGDGATSVEHMIDVRGSFTQTSDPANEFRMHNQVLRTVSYAQGYNATKYPPILQIGDLYALFVPAGTFGPSQPNDILAKLDPSATATGGMSPLTAEDYQAFGALTNDKMCIYMSAGAIVSQQYAPYFGMVIDVARKAA